jgi:flagellar basal body P-ring protein FlgI
MIRRVLVADPQAIPFRQVAPLARSRCLLLRSLLLHSVFLAFVLSLFGCVQAPFRRAKVEEENELQRYDISTIGDRTTVGNAAPVALGGVGLVEGLDGTGGDCEHDSYRQMLAGQLRKEGIQDVSQILKSPDCALVIVEAYLTPGAAKGDTIDIEVKLPPGSKATSLRGGFLRPCALHNYDFTNNLRPDRQGASTQLLGHKFAIAEGPIVTGMGDGDDSAKVKLGRVWAGGKVLRENPMSLVMNANSRQGVLTGLITERINSTFAAGGIRGIHETKIAHTADASGVTIRVPGAYKFNTPRFLRVVRFLPLQDCADTPGKDDNDKRTYRQLLAEDVLEPARCVVAALRLEALGPKSIPLLKKGLASSHPLVRFSTAEALTYLGSAQGVEELGRAASKNPMYRALALNALGSLNEGACRRELQQLITGDFDAETRVGAFRSLWTMDANDPVVQGENLNEAFWVHKIDSPAKPLVHVSTTKRAEILLFGSVPNLQAPFRIPLGEFTLTATEEDQKCTISRIPLGKDKAYLQCPMTVDGVVRSMSDLGATYPEIVSMLRTLVELERLKCPIRVDALPAMPDVNDLAKSGVEAEETIQGNE